MSDSELPVHLDRHHPNSNFPDEKSYPTCNVLTGAQILFWTQALPEVNCNIFVSSTNICSLVKYFIDKQSLSTFTFLSVTN